MHPVVFFSTLIVGLLPSISANPLTVVRRDNSTSTLRDAAIKAVAASIDVTQQFANLALSTVNSSSSSFGSLLSLQQLMSQSAAFTPFAPTINEIDCTYSNTAAILIPGNGSKFNKDIIASIIWLSQLISTTANSMVSNATELELSDADVQMVQVAGVVGNAISQLMIPAAPSPINEQDAIQLLQLTTWEAVHEIRTLGPKCAEDPGIDVLDILSVTTTAFGTPFAPGKGTTTDMSDTCPNGKNDTNCFCQTISPNLTTPVISPAQRCQMAASVGMNTFFVTIGKDHLSLNASQRAQQVGNGSIVVVDGPVPNFFGLKSKK